MTTASDPLDAAIAAAEAAPLEPRLEAQVGCASGRMFVVNFPADVTDAEWLDFVANAAGGLRTQVAAQRERRPTILVPRGVRVAHG